MFLNNGAWKQPLQDYLHKAVLLAGRINVLFFEQLIRYFQRVDKGN